MGMEGGCHHKAKALGGAQTQGALGRRNGESRRQGGYGKSMGHGAPLHPQPRPSESGVGSTHNREARAI